MKSKGGYSEYSKDSRISFNSQNEDEKESVESPGNKANYLQPVDLKQKNKKNLNHKKKSFFGKQKEEDADDSDAESDDSENRNQGSLSQSGDFKSNSVNNSQIQKEPLLGVVKESA